MKEIAALVLGATLWLEITPAGAIVACRLPNGQLMVANDAPDGCVVVDLKKRPKRRPPPPEPPVGDAAVARARPWPPQSPPQKPADGLIDLGEPLDDDPILLAAFDRRALAERSVIEERAERIQQRLVKLRERIQKRLDEPQKDLSDTPRGVEAYADALRRRDVTVERLRGEELGITSEWDEIEQDFVILSAAVQRAHGGKLPEEWHPTLVCESCP